MRKSRDTKNGKFQETHGYSRTSEYKAWQSMKDRCCKPQHPHYGNYGGRGITVCDRWITSFENFIADVGTKPSAEYSIDRIDNNGNYEPGNVRWATAKEQIANRRSNGAAKISAALTGRPHHERMRHICECGLITRAGPMKRHLNASGHTLAGECAAGMLLLWNRSNDREERYMPEVFSEFETASFLVYGETKHGKSSLLSTMPTPGVILDDEGKWQFFQGRKNPNRDGQPFRLKLWNPTQPPPENDGTWDFAIVKVTSAAVLAQVLPWIDRNDHPFVSIGYDSLTVGQEQGIASLRKVDEDFRIQDWGAIRRRVLSDLSRIMARVSDPANPLRVFAATAHGHTKDGKYRPAMQGGIQGRMPYSFDSVICMKKAFVQNEQGIITDDAASVFRALVKAHPAYATGSNFEDRFDRTFYNNPNLTHMMRTIFPASAVTKG